MKIKNIILMTISAFAILLFMSACSDKDEKNWENFNFTLNFGHMSGKNCIDTYNNKFTKDLISNGTETIDFTIPNEEKQEIYEAFLEYNISDLPDDVSGTPVRRPAYTFIFTYTWGKETRTIVCNDVDISAAYSEKNKSSDAHKRLVKFAYMIREYIYSTEEYENMPPSEGGYT